MFSFLNKVLGFIHSKPTISYLQPKTINVYFRNSIKQKYILLNVNKYDYCELDVEQVKEGDNNLFSLFVKLQKNNIEVANLEKLELGLFETRKEAEEALLVIRNKLFAIDKTLVKVTGLVLVLIVLIGLIADFSGNALQKTLSHATQSMQSNSTNPQTSPFMLPPSAGVKEMEELQKRLQDNANAALERTNNAQGLQNVPQIAPVQPVPEPKPAQEALEVQGNPEVNSFVNSLGK